MVCIVYGTLVDISVVFSAYYSTLLAQSRLC